MEIHIQFDKHRTNELLGLNEVQKYLAKGRNRSEFAPITIVSHAKLNKSSGVTADKG